MPLFFVVVAGPPHRAGSHPKAALLAIGLPIARSAECGLLLEIQPGLMDPKLKPRCRAAVCPPFWCCLRWLWQSSAEWVVQIYQSLPSDHFVLTLTFGERVALRSSSTSIATMPIQDLPALPRSFSVASGLIRSSKRWPGRPGGMDKDLSYPAGTRRAEGLEQAFHRLKQRACNCISVSAASAVVGVALMNDTISPQIRLMLAENAVIIQLS